MSPVSNTRDVGAPPAEPAPLDPGQFAELEVNASAATPTGRALTETDRATLLGALGLLKAARTDATSEDPKVAASGKRRVVALISYLAGFFDSRGLIGTATVKPGFESLLGSIRPDLDTVLDELEASLERALAEVETRSRLKENLNAVGDILLGGAGVALGILALL